MTLQSSTDLGLELIARKIALLLISDINTELATVDAAWTTLDQELATAQGASYVACTSDTVAASNIHVGHRPSFIESPVTNYPNLSVMSYNMANSPYRNIDHGEDISITTFVEGMVKDGPFASDIEFNHQAEMFVNKKVQRMVEAVHKVISSNPTLGGLIDGFEGAPRIVVTECMRRQETTEGGDQDYYWQMFRMEYITTRSLAIY